MSKLVEGKLAVVTGSSSGIGKGIARVLAREGADVVVHHRTNAQGAAITAREVEKAGGKALVVQGDVRVARDVDRMFDSVLEAFGRIDILVNNAGITTRRAFIEADESFFDAIIGTDLKGTFLCSRRAADVMKKQGAGRIINISSIHDDNTSHDFSLYAAAKAAVSSLTRGMAVDLADHGIIVNAISPGWVPVESDGEYPKSLYDAFCARIPLRRPGTPEDVGELAAFLACDRCRWLTGQVIHIDGGHSCTINMPSRRRDKGIYEGE